jgi:hypothetical protein
LSSVDYVGGSSPGSETLRVEAYDATTSTWSAYSSLTATTDAVPTVNVQNVSVAENGSIAASSLITSISNPSNDSIGYYAFYDTGGNGHFSVNGAVELDGQWVYVPASNLSNVDYVGGSSPGSEILRVEAYDATTSTWSAYSSLTATTDVVPTVNVQNVSVGENGSIAASSLITSISNPSNDSITTYGFYDTGGNGHFTVNGAAEPDGQWIYVPASDLGNVDYVGGSAPGSETLDVEIYNTTTATWSGYSPVTATTTANAFSLQDKGFDYPAFYNGAYEDSDSLPTLVQTGANSVEVTLDYGIDARTSQVVADPNYTDSLAALGDTIAQAESLGLTVMVRPLIDFLNPAESAPYSVGEWREYYQPTNVATFFASYQQMIVAEAEVAQANGAQMFCIGTELDQLTGPQYLPYWTDIINAVRGVFSGALTYSASWNTANEVSFWSQLNYEGIDCYVPLSNVPNPTLQDLVNGWLDPATPSTNPGAYAVIGNQSPIQYFENLSAESGKPLIFTEIGYANDSGAAADPAASGNSPDPALQAELYQAFFQAWQQSGSSALIGAYFWEWDPNSSLSNVGPNIDSFSPQNSPAQAQATAGFEAMSSPANSGVTISSGTTLMDESALTNTGTILIDGTWVVDVPTFTLNGNGAVTLSGGAIEGSASGETLINAGNTISGAGTIGNGNGHLALDNVSGTVEAHGGTLILDTGTSITNTGTLEAAPGATLQIDDPVDGTGGSATIGAGATLDLAAAYSGSVTFEGSTGVLKLGDAQTFSGQIFDLTGNGNLSSSDEIDLTDIAFGPQTTASYTGNVNGGTLTVTDAQHDTASIKLVGDYENSTFTLSSDGDGGTLVVDPPLSPAPASGAIPSNASNSAGPAAALSGSVTIGPGNDSFIFKPGFDSHLMADAASSHGAEWDRFSQLHTLLNEAQNGPQSLLQTAEDGHDTGIYPGHHDSVTLANGHLGDLYANSFIIR